PSRPAAALVPRPAPPPAATSPAPSCGACGADTGPPGAAAVPRRPAGRPTPARRRCPGPGAHRHRVVRPVAASRPRLQPEPVLGALAVPHQAPAADIVRPGQRGTGDEALTC